MKEGYDYFRLHMPSGAIFEASVPSLMSNADYDWLLQLVCLLRHEPLIDKVPQEVKPDSTD